MVFQRYMVDEIAIAAFLGDDGLDAVARFSAPVVHKARIEERTKTIRREDGDVVDATTWVATEADFGERDRIWIAPSNGNDSVRAFPPGFVFTAAAARVPLTIARARRRNGRRGFVELNF